LARCRASDNQVFETVFILVENFVRFRFKKYEDTNEQSKEEGCERDERLKTTKEPNDKEKAEVVVNGKGECEKRKCGEKRNDSPIKTVRA